MRQNDGVSLLKKVKTCSWILTKIYQTSWRPHQSKQEEYTGNVIDKLLKNILLNRILTELFKMTATFYNSEDITSLTINFWSQTTVSKLVCTKQLISKTERNLDTGCQAQSLPRYWWRWCYLSSANNPLGKLTESFFTERFIRTWLVTNLLPDFTITPSCNAIGTSLWFVHKKCVKSYNKVIHTISPQFNQSTVNKKVWFIAPRC